MSATKLKTYMAVCLACEGIVATACADDPIEEAEALNSAREWEARGDMAVVVEYAANTPNPFPWCSCERPRAHITPAPPPAVHWRAVTAELPDADETVLIHSLNANEPVWLGYLDGTVWRDIEGWEADVTHWAPMPAPPSA